MLGNKATLDRFLQLIKTGTGNGYSAACAGF